MGKIKKWYRSIPLWLAFFLFALAGLAASAFFANRVTGSKYFELVRLRENAVVAGKITDLQTGTGYLKAEPGDEAFPDMPSEPTDVKIFNSDTVTVSETGGSYYQYWTDIGTVLPPEVKVEYSYTMTEAKLAPFLIYAAGLLLAALLFWFTKLRRPLMMLEDASEKIAENELDFTLDYEGRDEIAKLCAAFERMRGALEENNSRMLRMIDEQHKLNDAYTHDLRTPIAVLKGYTDLLEKYMPTGKISGEEALDTLRTMSCQVARLEKFAGSMNTAQKLSDVDINRESVKMEDLAERLRETARVMSEGGPVSVTVTALPCSFDLNADTSAVGQVFDNLIGNALRFARSEVAVTLSAENGILTLRVTDDGPGFTDKELISAVNPYYSGGGTDGRTHFGLGLYICRTLCEKHGGRLTVANQSSGGGDLTAEFMMGEQKFK